MGYLSSHNTGGIPDINDKETGIVVEQRDVQVILDEIVLVKNKPMANKSCRKSAETFSDNVLSHM